MSSIQHQLLSFYTRRLTRSRRVVRTNVGFEQANSIGILYSGHSAEAHEAVRSLADKLERSGKKVTILYCATAPLSTTEAEIPTITSRAIGLFGKIRHPLARTFVNTPFDYLYQVDWKGHPVLDYLLARSRAKCRVGHYTAERMGSRWNCLSHSCHAQGNTTLTLEVPLYRHQSAG